MDNEARGTAIALGMFDGMHIGHRALVATNTAVAEANGLEPIVYTFENHPLSYLGRAPMPLSTLEQREKIMRELGAERVIFARFDKPMADTPAKDFIEMLLRDYNMRGVTVGFDYTFGRHAEGNIEMLHRMSMQYGFALILMPPVMYEGAVVSSTRIRECLKSGDIKKANAMLGIDK